MGNGFDGVVFFGAPNNTIGGTSSGARNLISGNKDGVVMFGAGSTGNVVLGNTIGTDATGTVALGNTNSGLFLSDAPNNTIGGTIAGARNVIAGNGGIGVYIQGAQATDNRVAGNFIGTDASGVAGLGNNNFGVFVNGAPRATIGGGDAAARNVISGNAFNGILIGSNSTQAVIQGNFIGVGLNGTTQIPNGGAGIGLNASDGRITSNRVVGNYTGGVALAASNAQVTDNVISNNFNAGGVRVSSGVGNTIRSNSIFNNFGEGVLGINLVGGTEDANGVTANDAGDGDTGSNSRQNYPAIDSGATTTFISGTLNSLPSTSFTVDVYGSAQADPSGFGEG